MSASKAMQGKENMPLGGPGMIGMSKALAAEVATQGITVNCITTALSMAR